MTNANYAAPRHFCASGRRYVLDQRCGDHRRGIIYRIWDRSANCFLAKAFRDADVAARYADRLEAHAKGENP